MTNMDLIRNAFAAAAKQFGAEEYELTITDKENTGVEALKKEMDELRENAAEIQKAAEKAADTTPRILFRKSALPLPQSLNP